MSTKSILLVCCVLVIAAIACNAPSPAAGGTTAAPVAGTTVAPVFTPSITPTVDAGVTSVPVATTPAIPPEGAFIPGPAIDVSGLPTLQILPMGMGPFFCNESPAAPTVTLENAANRIMQLCLYHFPTTEGAYTIHVKLVAPDAAEFTETYSVGATDSGPVIVDSSNEPAGTVYTAEMIGDAAPPQIGIMIDTEANIQTGAWQVEVSAPDAPGGAITVPLTPITVSHPSSLVSAISAPDLNPLNRVDHTVTTGETLHIFGTDYAPNTQLTVVLYYADPALPATEFGTPQLRPLTGTTVTTDAQGKFSVQFAVGANTPRGNYHAIAEPSIGPDYQLNPFVSNFIIE